MSSSTTSCSPHLPSTTSASASANPFISLSHLTTHPVEAVHISHARLYGKPVVHELTCCGVHDTHSSSKLGHHGHLVHHQLLKHQRIRHTHGSHVHARHTVHGEAAVHHHQVGVGGTAIRDAVDASLDVIVRLELWAMTAPRAYAVEETTRVARAVSVTMLEHRAGTGR